MTAAPASADYLDQLAARVNTHLQTTPLPADLLQRFPELKKATTAAPLKQSDLEDPELQQALSYIVKYTPSKWLLEQEKPFIQARRLVHQPANETVAADIYDWARQNQVTGLCFSGGGIRSATFNLGVLQALAMENRSKTSTTSPAFPVAATFIPGLRRGCCARQEKPKTPASHGKP